MTLRRAASSFLLGALCFAGCAHSTHKRFAPDKKPEGAVATPVPHGTTTENVVLKPGEYLLVVKSEPSGAVAVLNGVPCGKTPCHVIVQANRRGFLREQVSIKVRFIAQDESGASRTIEEVLTTMDKVPAEMRFTPNGATRIVR